MGNRVPFAEGEWYHCYSRGIDKRTVFGRPADYRRFTELLYLANDTGPVRRDDRPGLTYEKVFTEERQSPIVSVGAYALLTNHFHLVLFEEKAGGISRFMQKLVTGYSMYFNIRYKRSGGLFTRPFRSRHIDSDTYLQYAVDYVHLNPIEHLPQSPAQLLRSAEVYPYSSCGLFNGERRLELSILGKEIKHVYEEKPPRRMLESIEVYRSDMGKP